MIRSRADFIFKVEEATRNRLVPALQREREVTDVLFADLTECLESLNERYAHQPLRRSYIRTLAAYVEGVIFGMKQVVLASDDLTREQMSLERARFGHIYPLYDEAYAAEHFRLVGYPPLLSDAERALLREKEYRLSEGGKVEIRNAKLSLKANMQFAFATTAKQAKLDYKLPTDEHGGWDALLSTFKLRDLLMHPKTVADLFVADLAMDTAYGAMHWFFDVRLELSRLRVAEPDEEATAAAREVALEKLGELYLNYQQQQREQDRARSSEAEPPLLAEPSSPSLRLT